MMNERLKELRKEHLHLTLEKFGESLGVKNSAISKLENGRTNLTDQMILAICRTYNVNEEWLRNGTGPVFKDVPEEDESALALAEVADDPVIMALLKEYVKLDKTLRNSFKEYLVRVSEQIKEQD